MLTVGNLEEESSNKKGSSQKDQQQQDRRIDIQPAEDEEGKHRLQSNIYTIIFH